MPESKEQIKKLIDEIGTEGILDTMIVILMESNPIIFKNRSIAEEVIIQSRGNHENPVRT